MAEYLLAACALQDACTSAETFCLVPAASAETANDATRTHASVEITSFFMVASPLPPNASATWSEHFRSDQFPDSLFRNAQMVKSWLITSNASCVIGTTELFLLLAFQRCFVRRNKSANLVRHVEQLEPLFFI